MIDVKDPEFVDHPADASWDDDAVHEAHGGDEEPKYDECVVCRRLLDTFIRYAV